MATNGPNKDITYFAETDFRGKKVPFGIKPLDRARHFYVVGKTGMGKSTLLENITVQDINKGNGVGYIDPHGGSAELFLDYIPPERIKDVIYFAPHDLDFPIAFNVMEDVGKDQRHLVANGLMAAFKKIWPDVWSARMEYISTNIILALLEYPDSTLLGVNRMLSDKVYRKKVVDNVTDPVVKSFWVDEFAKYSDKLMVEAGASIQNKFGQFVSNPLIRNIVGQAKSTFDMREVMDGKKIIIMNLSKGRMGELNANLIGGMLITKIYLAAMSRASESEESLNKLPPFYFVVDEFQSFVNESFRDILSEARKYKLCLTIAHQYIEQIPEEVRDAVFGNVGTTVSFRVGPFDAEVLEKVFGPKFMAEDLVNLGFAQIYLTLMIDGVGSAPFSAKTLQKPLKPAVSHKDEVIEHSRKTYARPRAVVEEEIRKWHETAPSEEKIKVSTTGNASFSSNTPAGGTMNLGSPTTSKIDNISAGSYKTAYKNPAASTYKTPSSSANFRNSRSSSLPSNKRDNLPVTNRIELPTVSHVEPPAIKEREDIKPFEPAPLPAKMSLSSLAKSNPNPAVKPKSTGVNLGDLKSAIAEAMKSAKPADKNPSRPIEKADKPTAENQPVKIKTAEKSETSESHKNKEEVKPDIKEVPESVLRGILDTETNK